MENFEQLRPLLFAIAYRMVGSAMEAEDIVQDAWLRYQAVDKSKVESPKAYLTTIVSRLSLNHLNSARVQRELYIGPWLPEPLLGNDAVELSNPAGQAQTHDSISLAFLLLLEKLTPLERAVFLLREVFDYSYGEISSFVERSQPACRQLYSRAKRYLAQNRPRFESDTANHETLVTQFTQAIDTGNLAGLMNVLAEDVVFWGDGGGQVRGASTQPVSGAKAVAQFLLGVVRFAPPGYRYEQVVVNGRSGILIRTAEERPFTVIWLEIRNGRIAQIKAIANPDKLGRIH